MAPADRVVIHAGRVVSRTRVDVRRVKHSVHTGVTTDREPVA